MRLPTIAVATTARRLGAEALGVFLLVFGGVGTALFSADVGGDHAPILSVGYLGVALAFGLAVLVGSYVFGPISGGHFNPAVTLGLAASGRFTWSSVPAYIVAQVVGGVAGSSVLLAIVSSRDGALERARTRGFASNGYGIGDFGSPHGFSLGGVALTEFVVSAILVYVVVGMTARTANRSLGGLVVGFTVILIHLVSIPIDNGSANPARSLATAIYGGGGAFGQVWAFLVFPVAGALAAGVSWRFIGGKD